MLLMHPPRVGRVFFYYSSSVTNKDEKIKKWGTEKVRRRIREKLRKIEKLFGEDLGLVVIIVLGTHSVVFVKKL